MGSFFIDLLSFEHEVAVYERDPKRLRFTYNTLRFTTLEEIDEFKPELCINAVTVKYTIPAFREVIPHLPKECIRLGYLQLLLQWNRQFFNEILQQIQFWLQWLYRYLRHPAV